MKYTSMHWDSAQRIFAAVAIIVLSTMMLLVFLLTFAGCDSGYEANKRVNFDVCKAQCVDAGTFLGTFEQGIGYVKCSCITKDGAKE